MIVMIVIENATVGMTIKIGIADDPEAGIAVIANEKVVVIGGVVEIVIATKGERTAGARDHGETLCNVQPYAKC